MKELLRRYVGYLLTAVIAPVVTVAVYWSRRRIDLSAAEAEAVIRAETPLGLVQKALAQRDKELTDVRAQMQLLMTNHFEHDRLDREKLIEVMTKFGAAMQEITTDLKAHRTEESIRSSEIHQKLETMHLAIVNRRVA